MKPSSKHLALVVILLSSFGAAQVSTGAPPFASIGGGPFDSVNLGNLNVHFAIPVLHKAGRGMAFTYDLSYDSSVWSPVTASGVKQWTPVANWGWRGITEAGTGYTTNQSSTSTINGCSTTTYSSYVYHDPFGAPHPFVGAATFRSSPSHTCTTLFTGFTSTVSDGSGYTLNVSTVSSLAGLLTSRGGQVVAAQLNNTSGAATQTDANGNEITVNSSGQFFDTLSSSTPVLTVAGSSTTTFTYTAPSGGSASYTMNYTAYTVATAFGVSGIPEYGRTNTALVSSIQLPDSTEYQFTYEATPGSCTPLSGTSSCVTGRIYKVTLPTGGTITYTYSGGSNGIYSDGSTADLTRALTATTTAPAQSWSYVRAMITGTPAPGSTWTTTVTDPASNETVINFAEDGATNGPTTVATYNFYETQREVYQGSISSNNCSSTNPNNCLLLTTTACYNFNYSSCGTSTVTSPITQTGYYAQPAGGQTRLSQTKYNGYGLVTDRKEYTYGVALGAAPTSTYLVRETAISYATLGNNIYNKPSSVIVSDWTTGTPPPTTIASTTYAYDGTGVTGTTGTPQHVSITGSRGNLTTLTTSTSSTASLSKTFTYYDTGNPNVATDVNGAQTTYLYGSGANPYNGSLTASCGNSFATTIDEPLSLTRSMQWNCIGGIAPQVTDENNQTVKSDYTDSDFWRPADIYDQENNETKIAYTGQTAVETTLQNFNGGNSASDFRTTVDGFGRNIFSQHLQAPGGGNYDTGETDYNNLGQPYISRMPYSAAASPSSENTSAPATTTTYDALGRVLTMTDADGGTVAYTYTNNDVLQQVSGSQMFQKQFEYDGLGRLTSVCEMSTTLPGVGACGQGVARTGYLTKYAYDALGHLLGVTQNAQPGGTSQTRFFVYDWLGRMTQETNPESGAKNYVYDSDSTMCGNGAATSNGDLVKTTDAAGNCVNYYNDLLHRVTDIGNSNQSVSHCRRYRYDNSSGYGGSTKPTGLVNTLGRLIEAATDYCWGSNDTILTDEWFSYSPRGELTDVFEFTAHSGVYYHTTAAFWPTGALETLSGIPGVPTLNYGATGSGLDGEGRYTKVTASGSGPTPATNVTYSTSSTSNPLGALTGVTYGSTDGDSFTYDPNTGRPASYTFSVNGQNDVGTLTWNTNGTLGKLVIADSIASTSDSQTCTYTYDDLGRVGGKDANGYSVDCGSSKWQQLFTYDAFGNITKSGTSSFIPSSYSAATNQFTLSGVNVQYDGNGDLLTDNLNTYTWNVFGNMLSVNTISATYDAFGQVAEQYNGSGYTQILYSPVGKTALMNGTSLTKAFVNLPGGGTAIYNSSGLAYYRHSDWLGSSRLTSTQARGLYSSQAYAPFGEQYATYPTAGSLDPSYTSQNSDTVPSLYDFDFRKHSMSQGRWISPDPLGIGAVDPTNPQTWNRYAYVANNPLSHVDYLGLDDDECNPELEDCGNSGGGTDPNTIWGGDPNTGGDLPPGNPGGDCGGPCNPFAYVSDVGAGFCLVSVTYSTVDYNGASWSEPTFSTSSCSIPRINASANSSNNLLTAGLVFFKMKHRLVNSGPPNRNFQQPPERNPMEEMLEELEDKADKVNELFDVLVESIKILSRGGGSVSVPVMTIGPPCLYSPNLPCGGPPEL
jgi:RHS repeat-associated protein